MPASQSCDETHNSYGHDVRTVSRRVQTGKPSRIAGQAGCRPLWAGPIGRRDGRIGRVGTAGDAERTDGGRARLVSTSGGAGARSTKRHRHRAGDARAGLRPSRRYRIELIAPISGAGQRDARRRLRLRGSSRRSGPIRRTAHRTWRTPDVDRPPGHQNGANRARCRALRPSRLGAETVGRAAQARRPRSRGELGDLGAPAPPDAAGPSRRRGGDLARERPPIRWNWHRAVAGPSGRGEGGRGRGAVSVALGASSGVAGRPGLSRLERRPARRGGRVGDEPTPHRAARGDVPGGHGVRAVADGDDDRGRFP